MLYYDFKVIRPKGTKINRRNGLAYVYHVVSSRYIPEKKYNVDSKVCIGKMIDDTFMAPNDNYFKYYDHQVETLEQPKEQSDTLKIGNHLLIQKVMKNLGLDTLIDSVYEEKACAIKDILSYMLVTEDSVMQHYSDYAYEHCLFSNKVFDDCFISKLLKEGICYREMELFTNAWNQLQNKEQPIYISYDSTNMNTMARGIEIAEYGHAKDDDEKPQVNISYAIRHEDSMPLFQEIYPGSIVDIAQCKFMVEKAKELGYKNPGFILDRGYCSIENIRYFDKNDYGFLMMMKSNQKLVKEAIEEVRIKLRLNAGTYLGEHEVNGITLQKKLYAKDPKERYYHVYYDDIQGANQRNQLMQHYERIKKELDKKVDAKITRRENAGEYEKIFHLNYDDQGYLKGYRIKEQELQKQVDACGYFVIVSSKRMEAEEALSIYRNRDGVEKLFRNLKTWLGYDTYRVHTTESLESKSHLLFIASILRNEIYQKLKPIYKKDRKNYTVPSVMRELEKISVTRNVNGSYVRRYGLTNKQKKIYEQFGIHESEINDLVQQINTYLVIRK